jgi:RNA polymerase sigma factor (sigma-70 family)
MKREEAVLGKTGAPANGEDSDLLHRYADTGSQEAFAELVRRRIDLVYAVALRQTGGDRHRAEDATQAVFTDLARKARSLAQRPVLIGWLHRSARFAAAGAVRAELRRHAREEEAHTMEKLHVDDARDAEWQKLRPVIDEALGEIDERDRDAILLRYFDGRPFGEIGARLRLTENATRMRVDRALDRLQAALAKRGITSTSAALALALGPQIGAAAPAGLAASVTGAALAVSAAPVGWFASLMALNKLQIGVAALAVIGGTTMIVGQARSNATLRQEVAGLRTEQQQVAALRTENQQLATLRAENQQLTQRVAALTEKAQAAASANVPRPAARENGRLTLGSSDSPQLKRIQELDVLAQKSVEVMNRQGNRLVDEYKELVARSKDPSVAPDAQVKAAADAEAKLEAINAKKREVQDYIDATRAYLKDQVALAATGKGDTAPPAYVRLLAGTPEDALTTYEKISGVSIARDPSLVNVRGVVDVPAWMCAKAEALESLSLALRNQVNIVLVPTGNGGLIARLGQ